MGRRLNKDDLVGAARHFLELPGTLPFEWNVYQEYELVDADGARKPLTEPHDEFSLRTSDKNSVKHTYRPLVDTEHLFLEFARLWEHRDREEALIDWISRRGLLGFHKRARPREEIKKDPQTYRFNRDYWWSSDQDLTEYMHEGGPSERWGEVVRAAANANFTLRRWEAVLSRDPEQAEKELASNLTLPEDMVLDDPYLEEEFAKLSKGVLDRLRKAARLAGFTYREFCLHQVAHLACQDVQVVLEAFAFPCPVIDLRPAFERQSSFQGPDLVSGSWQPRNLLGAMYLQMYQLMISSGGLSRCRYCGGIIFTSQPMPWSKKRRTYKNKEFCNKQCRQNYHYHNRLKPKRNAERNGGND
jgi:hypothetical protein